MKTEQPGFIFWILDFGFWIGRQERRGRLECGRKKLKSKMKMRLWFNQSRNSNLEIQDQI